MRKQERKLKIENANRRLIDRKRIKQICNFQFSILNFQFPALFLWSYLAQTDLVGPYPE
jgi:hypothetical protein